MHVTIVVISTRLFNNRKHAVRSWGTGIDSDTPPVKSANPSRNVPYFNASYDPCNLCKIYKKIVMVKVVPLDIHYPIFFIKFSFFVNF